MTRTTPPPQGLHEPIYTSGLRKADVARWWAAQPLPGVLALLGDTPERWEDTPEYAAQVRQARRLARRARRGPRVNAARDARRARRATIDAAVPRKTSGCSRGYKHPIGGVPRGTDALWFSAHPRHTPHDRHMLVMWHLQDLDPARLP